ncbi:universal stress protein [Kitasatospora sp. NBC_01266]|uniref:universal stress protein n=1 Tax=Kitasatospora sp. NBC_01266 TaxID=2903572 RepID=UPI002E32DF7D|nr:universal stress protein [Kitasatospora sp. NBC_01266]
MANQQIITGFDGSEPSRAAARWAAREAVRRGLPLQVLQAWPWGPSRPLGTGQAERWGREQLATEADALRALWPA